MTFNLMASLPPSATAEDWRRPVTQVGVDAFSGSFTGLLEPTADNASVTMRLSGFNESGLPPSEVDLGLNLDKLPMIR